jgi:hypothetical protein
MCPSAFTRIRKGCRAEPSPRLNRQGGLFAAAWKRVRDESQERLRNVIEAQNDDQGGDEQRGILKWRRAFRCSPPRRLEGADLLRLADLRRHQPLGNLPFPPFISRKGEGIGDVVPQLRIFFLQPPGDLSGRGGKARFKPLKTK